MSGNLCVGLAKKIAVTIIDKEMGKEVELYFFKKVDKNLYNVGYVPSEKPGFVTFELKDEMLAKYAMDLMIEQHERYLKSRYSEEAIEYYKNIKSKDEKEIINIINTENNDYMYTFRTGLSGFDISYLFGNRVEAHITEFLTFHCSQKTFMEENMEFFKYMRNLLIYSTYNPLRTALAIAL